ncbi:MAG TPA: alpha/beta hydrolase [Caulobacteraceae bacterium]|jgi:pimeloyl-ACP methyl ester carboxylesterase
MKRCLLLLAALLLIGCHRHPIAALVGAGTGEPAPPEQALSGPGGNIAPSTEVFGQMYGRGATAYWLFVPTSPAPASAPLVVFNHGWTATDPRVYHAWIDHIVRRGEIVVYPIYQGSLLTPVNEFTPNALAAVKAAILRLQTEPGHVRPDLTRFALVGHSMGGPISANLAADWQADGLPQPRALMALEPGKTWGREPRFRLSNLAQIPAGTLLITEAGDRDIVVGDTDAKRIFNEATSVRAADKNFVTLVSDDHGSPALLATHLGAVGRNALAYYGVWKLFDGLTDAAFYGKNREYALGNTAAQRFMGVWSDGVPVKELVVTQGP